MTPRFFPLLAGLALLAAAPTAMSATGTSSKPSPPRVVRAHYYGPSLGGYPGLTWNNPEEPLTALGDGGLGAILILLRAGDASASILPSDASSQPVGGSAYFIRGNGESIGRPFTFCGRSRTVAVPSGAASLRVSLDPTVCPGLVTEGTVTATLAQRQPRRR